MFLARAAAPHLPGIKKVGIKHEAILNFLLAHPNVKMREVAEHFQVSQPWLSLIIHSDAFQRLLRERQDVHFHVSILPMMGKMEVAAEKAIDRMIELIPFETDLGKLNQVADKALNRLGYGTSNVQQIQADVQVRSERSALERARTLIGARPKAAALEGEVVYEAGLASEVQEGRDGAVGETPQVAASVSPEAPHIGSSEAGGSV
jgi:hypothetical protein